MHILKADIFTLEKPDISILGLQFMLHIRDFMLNKKDILGWNISIKLMHIQSMLH